MMIGTRKLTQEEIEFARRKGTRDGFMFFFSSIFGCGWYSRLVGKNEKKIHLLCLDVHLKCRNELIGIF